MKRLLSAMTLTAFAAVASATPVLVAGKTRYIVTFDGMAKQADRDSVLAAQGLTAAAHITTGGDTADEISIAIVDVPGDKTPPIAGGRITAVERDQNVKWIESAATSFQATPFSFSNMMEGLKMPKVSDFRQNPPSFLMFAKRPELTWGVTRVHAPAAWAVCARDKVKTCEGAFVKVAVIDTGIGALGPARPSGRRLLGDNQERKSQGLRRRQRDRARHACRGDHRGDQGQ